MVEAESYDMKIKTTLVRKFLSNKKRYKTELPVVSIFGLMNKVENKVKSVTLYIIKLHGGSYDEETAPHRSNR